MTDALVRYDRLNVVIHVDALPAVRVTRDFVEADIDTRNSGNAFANTSDLLNGCASVYARNNTDYLAPNLDPEWHEAKALAHLAVARHLREHPRADKKQVAALSRLIAEAATDGFGAEDPPSVLAERLVLRGVRVELTEDDK